MKAGQSAIFKANEMIQGFPVIQFEAEEGVQIQFAFGYTGDSTSIGNTYGSASFYTARSGDQTYIPTDSYGFRYLKISVLNGSIYSSSPATGTEGTVYVGSNDKKLYAIVSKQWPCSKSLAKVRQV